MTEAYSLIHGEVPSPTFACGILPFTDRQAGHSQKPYHHIMNTLDAQNRTEAASKARSLNILPNQPFPQDTTNLASG